MAAPTIPLDQQPDVDEMYVIHRVFRRELPALAKLVRSARPDDVHHAHVVGSHLRLILKGLHMHHSGEDAVIWPVLLDRAPEAADTVRRLQAQHEEVASTSRDVDTRLGAWTEWPSETSNVELADAIDILAGTLIAHLDLEEHEGLPLLRRWLTREEWALVGAHGRSSMSAHELPLMFGLLLEDATAAEAARLRAELPAPARLYLRTLGARRYRSYMQRVRQTDGAKP